MSESDEPKDLEDLKVLEFTIISKKKLRPQKCSFLTIRILKLRFPSTLSSITEFKYSNLFSSDPPLLGQDLSILQKRGILPCAGIGYQYFKNLETQFVLKKILKEAKSLRSLYLEFESNFKGIRKARGLKELFFKISTGQISAYPGLFKHLLSLQKVVIFIEFWSDNDGRMMSKFFGFVLDLPKLECLVIWLEQGWDYYKNLLFQIHQKSLPSFEVIVFDTKTPPDLPNSLINWADYVDTLYLGPISSGDSQGVAWNQWNFVKESRKIVRFNDPFRFDEEDVTNGSRTIKNLMMIDLFCDEQNAYEEDAKSLLTFISCMEALENLTLSLGPDFIKSSDRISPFLKQFARLESLENLTSFTFNLSDKWGALLKVSPPYGHRMMNLRNLYLILYGKWVNWSDWTDALKDLVSLESFYFVYVHPDRNKIVHWSFPFGWLRNLKTIYLHCGNQCSESSIDELIQSISKVESLESLEILGRIFDDLDRNKADRLVENLCSKKSLETVNLTWKETKVMIQRVNGKLVVSSERNR